MDGVDTVDEVDRILTKSRQPLALANQKTPCLRVSVVGLVLASSQKLFIRQGFHGVFFRGAEGWVCCAQDGAGYGYHRRIHNPTAFDQHLHSGEARVNQGSGQEAQGDADHGSADGQEDRLPQHQVDYREFRRAQRFEDSDLMGALQHRGVHGLKDHDEADDDGYGDHYGNNFRKAGDIAGRHQREPLTHGTNLEIAASGECVDGTDHPLDVVFRGVIKFDIEDGGFALRADQLLHAAQGDVFARAFAVLHDAGHAEAAVPHGYLRADGHVVGLGKIVVDDDIVGLLKLASGYVRQWAGDFRERRRIDTVDGLDASGGVELNADGSDRRHMRQLAQNVGQLGGHRQAGEAH